MSKENVEIARRTYEAVSRGDLATANSYIHPDIEFHTYARAPEAGVYRGRDAVQRYNENLFEQFDSLRIEVEEVVDFGSRVVVVSTQHAIPKQGQEAITVHLAEVWTVRDGLLAERHSYSTKDQALEAAGRSE
jgi:ketosteroid isomerase-like protein